MCFRCFWVFRLIVGLVCNEVEMQERPAFLFKPKMFMMLRIVRLGWFYVFVFPFFVVGYLYCCFILLDWFCLLFWHWVSLTKNTTWLFLFFPFIFIFRRIVLLLCYFWLDRWSLKEIYKLLVVFPLLFTIHLPYNVLWFCLSLFFFCQTACLLSLFFYLLRLTPSGLKHVY